MLSAWARGIRARHQAHCGERKVQKASQACFRSSVDRVKVSSWLSARRDGRVVEDASGQIFERKAREPCGCDVERKRNLMSEAPEELRKQTFQKIRDLDEKISGE